MRHVDVSFQGQRILGDISWQLREGEHWAFLGGNGAGKTTLLKLIRGELWPDAESRGRRIYRFNGSGQESPVGLKERIAFVSPERQDAYARNGWDLTGEEVIHTGFFDTVWLQQKPGDGQRAYAEHLISLLKLGVLRNKSILEMSEGEGRKILIARALASRPRVLLLDEFCSGLDIPSRRKLLHLLERIAQGGTQIVFATHRVEELLPSISHVLLLKSGKVMRSGERESVLAPETVTALRHSVRRRKRIPGESSPHGERTPDKGVAHLVNIRNADVYLDGKKILEEIRWKMLKNENWAILGKNGAGKSTLLKLILGDIHPALGGTISRFGTGEGDIMDVKKRIGYLSSELQGNYDLPLTGEEIVHSGFFSSIGLYHDVTDRQKEIAKKWIRFFGAEALCSKEILTMSYGELRKMLTARAMVNHPDILMLDEPCSGLDMAAREDLLNALEKLSRTGTRIILVTHHPEDLIPSITHLLVMEDGRILVKGRKERVLRKKSLSALFGDLSRSPLLSGTRSPLGYAHASGTDPEV
jgi:molybdate transport system ATP-binding protein